MREHRWDRDAGWIILVALLLGTMWMLWVDPVKERTGALDGDRSSVAVPASCQRRHAGSVAEPMRLDESRRFAVRVPQGWDSEVDEGLVVLRETRGRAVLSVGSIPPRDPSSAMEELRLVLYRSYRKVRLTLSEPILLRGCQGREASGVAVNDQGVRLMLRVLLVQAPGDTYTLAGFVKPGAHDSMRELLAAMHSIRFL